MIYNYSLQLFNSKTILNTCFLYGVGDYIAQTIEKNKGYRLKYDLNRTSIIVFIGTLLDNIPYFTTSNIQIYDTSIFIKNIFFILTFGIISDTFDNYKYKKVNLIIFYNSIKKVWNNVKNVFFEIYMINYIIRYYIQIIKLTYIPTQLQSFFTNIMDIGMNTYLSFISQDY